MISKYSNDITNQRFGNLTAIRFIKANLIKHIYWWEFRCDCGRNEIRSYNNVVGILEKNHVPMCLKCSYNFKNLTGKTFGRLTVVSYLGKSTHGSSVWKCVCSCGNITNVRSDLLLGGRIMSCGCLRNDTARKMMVTHNESKTRLYRIWGKMKCRCSNPSYAGYHNYGGRGITVCDEWNHDYMAFRNWAINNGYKDDLTIERIDVNGNYCPENCTWVSRLQQAKNTRKTIRMPNNLCLKDYCKLHNLDYHKTKHLIHSGLSVNQIEEMVYERSI